MATDFKVTLPVNLPKLLARIENAYIDAAMKQMNGNKTEAGKLLGLKRTTLVMKLRSREAKAAKKNNKSGVGA